MLSDSEASDLAGRLYNALEEAESDRAGYLASIKTVRELLRADQPRENPPWEGACDLHLPLLRSFRNAFLARANRALLTPSPIHYVEGRGQMEREAEGDVEQFVFEQCRRVLHLPRTYRPMLHSTFDDGTGVAYVTWETRTTRRLRYREDTTYLVDEMGEPVADEQGVPIPLDAPRRQAIYQEETVYDGPRVRVLPIDQAGVYPAAERDVQTAPGAYVRLSMTGTELWAGVTQGLYDRAAVLSVLEQQSAGEVAFAQTDEQEGKGVTLTDASMSSGEPMSRRYDVVEWYWSYAKPGQRVAMDWLITMHQDSRTILRATPNPWGHGRRPIVISHVLPPKFGIVGESLGDLAGSTQRFVATLLRLVVDASVLQIDPEIAVGSGITPAEVEKWQESRGPGKIRKFNADDLSKVIQPFSNSVDPRAVMPMVQELISFAERSTGYNNAFAGQPASRAITATELERMLEEGSELIMDMIDCGSHAVTDVGELILALDYEFSGNASVQQCWDAANPHLAGADITTILGGEYDVTAAGTSATANKAIQAKNAQEQFLALKDDPFVLADPTGKRSYALRRRLLVNGYRMRRAEAEALIGTEQEAQMIPAAQQAAQLMQVAQEMQAAMPPEGDAAPMAGDEVMA